MPDLDGNVYPIAFRLHDNRYNNSPVSKRNGEGYLISDYLQIGEPTYNPVTNALGIGNGLQRSLTVAAGDSEGNLKADITPLVDTDNNYLDHKTLKFNGKPLLELSYSKISVSPAIMVVDGTTDRVKIGHGHMRAAVNLLFNIQNALTLLLDEELTDGVIAKLYDNNRNIDLLRLDHRFSESYGFNTNVMHDSEDLTENAAEANVLITPNVMAASTGMLTLDRLEGTISTTTADTCYVQKTATVVADRDYCASVILKRGTSPKSSILFNYTGGVAAAEQIIVTIDWDTLTISQTESNDSWQGGVIAMSGDFYRLWASGPSYDNTTASIKIFVRDTGTVHVDEENVYVGGVMLNRGVVPGPYVITT